MTAEQKAAMDEAFDMIVELTEFVKEQRNYIRAISNHQRFEGIDEMYSKACEIHNDARGVLDLINEELYKTL
mgnify:CR=1 FL=1|jgi:hypothetical protein